MDGSAASLASRLRGLADNLWWTWQPEVIAIFRDIDTALWREHGHNPIAFLAALPPALLAKRAEETALESRLNHAVRRLEEYLEDRSTWGNTVCATLRTRPVAYFSAEFALHESFPMYSGGLGVLAGDHLKSASDLGVPLVGVGVAFSQGYFRQSLDPEGWQTERYPPNDWHDLPVSAVNDAEGRRVRVQVETRSGIIRAHVWRVQVGRTMLLLLDSNVEGNSPEDRNLTA